VTVEQTEAEKLVEYMEDPTSPTANYANVAMPAIKGADHVRSLQLLDKVYIIDIRAAADYDAGHIEGAVNVATADLLTHVEGVDLAPYDEVSIVCYSGQTAGWAASLLRLLGYDKVFSLKWGMCSWNAATSGSWTNPANVNNSRSAQFVTTATPKGPAGDLPTINTGGSTPQEILEARVEAVLAEGFGEAKISNATVYGALSNYYIVNYWPEDHYTGMGHIEGAVNIPYFKFTGESGAHLLQPEDELHKLFEAYHIEPETTIVVYCGSGIWASTVYFAAKCLGYNVRLYDGSIQEWGRDESLPISTR